VRCEVSHKIWSARGVHRLSPGVKVEAAMIPHARTTSAAGDAGRVRSLVGVEDLTGRFLAAILNHGLMFWSDHRLMAARGDVPCFYVCS